MTSTSSLFHLQPLKLTNSLLKRLRLNLQINELLSLNLLQFLTDLCLVCLVLQDLALFLESLLSLFEFLGGFGNFGVDVYTAFDV